MADLAPGSYAWVASDSDAWAPGQIMSVDGGSVSLKMTDGTVQDIPAAEASKLVPVHPSCLEGVDDMVTLGDMHEAGLLHTLRLRYQRDLIYTYTGAILVSVNPYQTLDIYNQDTIEKYRGQRMGSLPPHIFAVADQCYRNMVDTKANQSVIISGESGAGKTEATKLILQYLAAVSGKHSWVQQQILDSSPVLEAFGNAKTVRNDNSSRFGKFIEIHFDKDGHICGASIENYLLEKSRIVAPGPDERSYHIFYQFLAGADDEEKAKYHLKTPQDYKYLASTGVYSIDGVDDAAEFARVRMSMTVLNMDEEEVDAIFRILAAILNMGNVEFKKSSDGESCSVENEDVMKIVADLLQTDPTKFKKALEIRTVSIRGQTFEIPLKQDEAYGARDAFCKTIYGRMFDWIVKRINDTIRQADKATFIGVLDIFGFESFQTNSFEQFCINFANEKLQQHFNHFIFKVEQEEYTKEKIDWSAIDFVDNQECLDLIEKKPVGICQLIDEMCKAPQATDQALLDKLHKNHEKHPYYERPRRSRTAYGVKHYAGLVNYEIENYLDKNKDTLYWDFVVCMKLSDQEHIRNLFPDLSEEQKKEQQQSGSGGGSKSKGGAKQTVAMFFKEQLTALMTTINATQPHFVRCVKPNTVKKPSILESPFVLRQLRYAGMMEAVRIRRMGFPIRRLPDEFYKRYRCLKAGIQGKDFRELSTKLMATLEMDKSQWQMGITKVFLREQTFQQLEGLRQESIKGSVLILQGFWRMIKQRKWFLKIRVVITDCQRVARGYIGRQQFRRLWAERDRQRAAIEQKALMLEEKYMRSVLYEEAQLDREREAKERAAIRAEEKYQREITIERKKQELRTSAASAPNGDLDNLIASLESEKAQLSEQLASDAADSIPPPPPPPPTLEDLTGPAPPPPPTAAGGASVRSVVSSGGNSAGAGAGAGAGGDNIPRLVPADKVRVLGRPVKVAFPYDGGDKASDKIAINVGDTVIVMEVSSNGWCRGEVNGKAAGWFPLDYVVPMGDEAAASSPALSALGGGPPPPPPVDGKDGTIANGTLCRALFDFAGMDESQLSFKAGDSVVMVEHDDSGWCLGQLGDKQGWFPVDFVAPIVEEASKQSSVVEHAQESALAPPSDNSLVVESLVPERVLPPDSYKYTLESFAKQNLVSQKKGTFRKKTVDVVDLIVWSKEPLTGPLTKLDDPTDVQEAVAINHSIMKFMGDYSSKKDPEQLLMHVLQVGMSRNEAMRDEIYIQICKQVSNNMKSESVNKGWEMMAMLVSFFGPSKSFEAYLLNFISKHRRIAGVIGDYAHFCLSTLNRTLVNGKRRHLPGIREMDALRNKKPIVLKIYFVDKTTKGLAISSQTTAREVVAHLARKLHIKSHWAFALVAITLSNGNERILTGDEHMMDIMTDWEAQGITGKFLFKNRMYVKSFDSSHDDGLNHALYIHTLHRVLSGVYPCSPDDAVKLAALQVQIETHGKQQVQPGFITTYSHRFLPKSMVMLRASTEWEADILEEFAIVQSMTTKQAKVAYVTYCRQWPFFGQEFYPVEQSVQVGNIPKKFTLGISWYGVHFLESTSKTPLKAYAYGEVANWGFSNNTFVIITGDLRKQAKYLLKTNNGTEISALVQAYINRSKDAGSATGPGR